MSSKLWFHWGIGTLFVLLIIKNLFEISWIFDPILSIADTILVPVLLAGFLYYLLEPLQRFLESKGVAKGVSIAATVLLLLGGVFSFVFFIGDSITNQVKDAVEKAPYIAFEVEQELKSLLEGQEGLMSQSEEMIASISASVSNSIQNIAVEASKYILILIGNLVSAIFTLVLVLLFFIYMLKDHRKFAPAIYRKFEGKKREWVKNTLEQVDLILRNYVQGQVLVSLILASMLFAGYQMINLENSLLLTIFAFFMNMIPFIGPWIALVPAAVAAFIQDPVLIIGVCIVTLAAQQIESNLVAPKIIGSSLDIHPLTIISIVLAAGNMAGFTGALISIPLYAVIKAVAGNVYKERKTIKKLAVKSI